MSDLIVTRQGAQGFGRWWPCAIGRGGVTTQKTEGDGATPAGNLTITSCLYRADRLSRPSPWARKISLRDLWCDDPDHPLYNQLARAPLSASHERLTRADHLYDIILTTDWNWPIPVAGLGSAIFIHRWRKPRHPTEGCVAFAHTDLVRLASLLAPGNQIEIRP